MKVKVNFEFDLEGLVEANKDHILLKGRNNEDIINEYQKNELNKLQVEDIPPNVKELIKKYFTND